MIITVTDLKHNYFYKITNLVNGKYYYGIHSTYDLTDEYMGSGALIKKAIEKYGKENFKIEILKDFADRHSASLMEKIIVTKELLDLEECYNLKTGGDNEFQYHDDVRKAISLSRMGKYTGEDNPFYGKTHSEETKIKIRESKLGKPNYALRGRIVSQETINKILANRRSYVGEGNPNFGKPMSDETKEKISKGNTGKIRTQEFKDLISESNRNREIKDSTRQKLSIIQDKNKKKCLVEGVVYDSMSDVARYYNLCHDLVRYRINSKLEKWENWNFL